VKLAVEVDLLWLVEGLAGLLFAALTEVDGFPFPAILA